MALQSGAMVAPEKVLVQWYPGNQLPPPPPHHQVDEREGLLMWLRAEFAAANAIIDSLCHHLREVGDPGEYDGVIGCIQQRRCNWSPILHMQQYFPVAEVVYALQHAAWRRQRQGAAGLEGSGRVGGGGKDLRRGGRWQRGGFEGHNSGWEVNGKDLNNGYGEGYMSVSEKLEGGYRGKAEEKEQKKETNEKSKADNSVKGQGSTQRVATHGDESCLVDGSKVKVSPQTFVANEICEGKLVNFAEGLKLYDDLFDGSEISKLSSLVNDLRASGKRGQLKGLAFITLRRPMRGHGREIIQLGVPIADANPDYEEAAATSRDVKTEPIPELLQDIIQRLFTEQVVSIKPDSAIIDVFNEGDYSQPHMWSQSFGRPVCLLFLTECEMSFSKVITADRPGEFRASLKLSLSPGSMLVIQGKAADFARHAISSQRKQRILITLTKSQPKKLNAYAQRFPPTPSNWAPPPSRPLPNHIRPGPAKHFGPNPTQPPPPSVLPTPGPPLPPSTNIQPIFISGPLKPTTGQLALAWPMGPPTSPAPPPRLLVPGTGVFIPPQGSGNALGQQPSSTENMGLERRVAGLDENGGKESNDCHEVRENECNGTVVKKREEHENNEVEMRGIV